MCNVDKSVESVDNFEEPQLYIEYHGDKPVKYGYGLPWVATAMSLGDYGYPTEEEAIKAYEREVSSQ